MGELKASRQKETFINGEDDFLYNACLGLLYQTLFTKYQKKLKAKAVTRDKLGRNKKM